MMSRDNVIKVTIADKATNVGEKSVTVSNSSHSSHSDNCYNGTKHSAHIGDEINGGDCYQTQDSHKHTTDCYSLENVYYEGTIEDWCNISFENEMSNPMYYANIFWMLDENGVWNEITQIEIPDTVTHVGYCQFYGFDNVTEFYLPTSVTSIEEMAFSHCESLYSIDIPESVHYIALETFGYCYSLNYVIIPVSVNIIDQFAFYECYNLTHILYKGSSSEWE